MMNVDGGKVMKMNKIMLIICAYAVLLSSFFRIPYLSTTWFKIVVLLYGFIVSVLRFERVALALCWSLCMLPTLALVYCWAVFCL